MRSRRSLCLIKLLAEVAGELARVHGHRPTGQGHLQILPQPDFELAAVQAHDDPARPAAEMMRDGRAARPGARRQRLADAALEDAGPDHARLELAVPRDVGAVGEERVALDRGPDRIEVERIDVLAGDRALGVADRDVPEAPA